MSNLENTPDTPAETPVVQARPVDLPEKFWNNETGTVRLDALIKSYRELEKRFTQVQAGQVDDDLSDEQKSAAMLKLLGRPDTPDDYEIKLDHAYFAADPGLHQRLHTLGFTNAQVQAVYDLAAEKLVPMILDVMSDIEAERELDTLIREFGGPGRWPELARQMLAFGRKALPPHLLTHLAGSADGIRVLYHLMTREDEVSGIPVGLSTAADDGRLDRLQALVRDPRYWRDHDPKFVDRVTKGFERVYGE